MAADQEQNVQKIVVVQGVGKSMVVATNSHNQKALAA